MAAKVSKNIITSGKRKTSVARAIIAKGSGIIRINHLNLNVYSNEIARLKIMEPLMLSDDLAKGIDIKVNVKGGGWQSQAEAARLAIAKAMVDYFKKDSLRNKFLEYDRNLLVADIRRTEPQKSCRSSARAGKQMSKR